MKKWLVTGLALLLLSAAAHAEVTGDAAAGRDKAAVCGSCHGADGNSTNPAYPKLAGQNARYLSKQIRNIQCGALSVEEQEARDCLPRTVPTMARMVAGLSEQDIADIAAYYAEQTPTLAGAEAGHPEAPLALGERIYRAGLAEKGVAACTACHSPTGAGNALAGFPALSGQYAAYTAAQLRAFRTAAQYSNDEAQAIREAGESVDTGRRNDSADEPAAMMRAVAAAMTDREIEAVANYIAGLH